jgi:hypothetical protein
MYVTAAVNLDSLSMNVEKHKEIALKDDLSWIGLNS